MFHVEHLDSGKHVTSNEHLDVALDIAVKRVRRNPGQPLHVIDELDGERCELATVRTDYLGRVWVDAATMDELI